MKLHVCHRYLVLIAAVLLVQAKAQAEPLHPCGWIRDDPRTAPWMVEDKLVPSAPRSLGVSVDLSSQMPPVGNQGSQGSCCAWAIGYYQKTHYEWLEHHWNDSLTSHQFSPAFIYNQINGGADQGSGSNAAYALIADQGCATMADCPYNQNDCTTWPSESAYARAIPYRGSTSRWFSMTDSVGINRARQRLDSGYTTVIGISVYSNFDNIQNYNYTYCVADKYGSNRGGHVVTIVGYNDTITTHDGPGAFKLVNSWGTGWGLSGYWWMSYVAATNTELSAQVGVYQDDRIAYAPTMLGRVRLTHAARDKIGIRLGIGPPSSPLWSRDFRTWRSSITDRAFPSNNIVFDMTEGEPYITYGLTDSVFVRAIDDVADSQAGTVDYFAAQHLAWDTTGVSSDTPVSIPDYDTAVFARAKVPKLHDVGAYLLIAPTGTVDSGSSTAPQARVKNYGLEAASFPVVFRIGAYADTQNVTNLATGDSATLTFDSWTATARGVNATRCSTGLSNDRCPANDKQIGSVIVRVRDVACTQLLAPPGTVDSGATIAPRAVVRNAGTTNETFDTRFAIGLDYADTVSVTLGMGMSDTLNFASWSALALGTFPVACSTMLSADMNPANNTVQDSVTVGVHSGIAEQSGLPKVVALERPVPDPMTGVATIRFSIPRRAQANVSIRSASGALVRVLSGPRPLTPGTYSLTWDGRDDQGRRVAQGVYFYRLESDNTTLTRKAIKID
ncbi:MAG: T9SS type A sorting domain-containing protein [candidate division WOR-3 bacterium]|nr:T9SS type A sorting domain-containing protein [candidate division WOR-3 bacterium]